MESDPVFARFVERRSRLMERLDASRARMDDWIAAHESQPASVTELAHLEGLLAERRNLLDELLKLDDSLLEHLVVLLERGRSNPST